MTIEQRRDERFQFVTKLVYRLAIILILGSFALFSSCTVITSFDDAEVAKAKAEQIRAEEEGATARGAQAAEMEKARLATIEKLVSEHGYGPVAARCAVKGWPDKGDSTLCSGAMREHETTQRLKHR